MAAMSKSPGRHISADFWPACSPSRCSIPSSPTPATTAAVRAIKRPCTRSRWGHLAAAIIQAYLFESRRQATNAMRSSGVLWGDERLALRGLGAFKEVPMTVKAILSRKGGDVLTIAPTASLSDAVKLLAERRIGALVVTGPDSRVAGILSERDIVRTLAERGPAALEDNVGAVMTRKVTTCTEADTIAHLMERMTER